MTTKAFAYLRTSSAANVGENKDSDKRQRQAIVTYAKAYGFEIVGEYYDADTKGSEPVYQRPAFSEMLAVIAGNGVRTIIVEGASRFARDLIVQETGYQYLRDLGITLIAADDPDAFTAETRPQCWSVRSWVLWRSSRRPRWSPSSKVLAIGFGRGKVAARVQSQCRKRSSDWRGAWGGRVSVCAR